MVKSKGKARAAHRAAVGEDEIQRIREGYIRGWELQHVRTECKARQMERCYYHYLERFMVTNVAIFLFIFEFIVGIHYIMLNILTDNFLASLPYLLALILMPFVLYICFQDRRKFSRFRLWNMIASCVALLLITLMDTFVNLMFKSKQRLVTFYEIFVLLGIYFFLPVGYFRVSCLFNLGICLIYIGYAYIRIPCAATSKYWCLASYSFFLLTINVLMLAFKVGQEFHLRILLLNRQRLQNQTILLQLVLRQEREILRTILPREIADSWQQEIQKRIQSQFADRTTLIDRLMSVELYQNVSILVGRLLNYQQLTSTMRAPGLLELLHQLIKNFDLSAQQHHVIGITSLGEIYTFFSGQQDVGHAKACVTLGLEMIRDGQDLGCEMRIAVHTGEIYAGIIGRVKSYLDVWSRDVDLTHRLESSGQANFIHVSQKTLALLKNAYVYQERGRLHKVDAIPKQMKTYLISPQANPEDGRQNRESLETVDPITLTATSIYDHNIIHMKTHRHMLDKINQMPVGNVQVARIFNLCAEKESKEEDILFLSLITRFWRFFRDPSSERSFMNQPDVLIKYSLLMAFLLGMALFAIHILEPYSKYYIEMGVSLLLLLLICLIGFYKKIWTLLNPLWMRSQPSFLLSRCLFRLSELIEHQLFVRIIFAYISILILYAMSTINAIKCDSEGFQVSLVEVHKHRHEVDQACFDPWDLTEHVLLVLLLLILFFGLPLVYKLIIAGFIIISHLLSIYSYSVVYRRTEAAHRALAPFYAHVWILVALLLVIFIKDLHLSYLSRVQFHFKLLYEEKLKETENRISSINLMLENILPKHVAEIFHEHVQGEAFFHESHKNVAVLVASLKNYDPQNTSIRVLNDYISCFDDLLVDYENHFKVEKIKITGWSYVAACGLHQISSTNIFQQVFEHLRNRPTRLRTGISFRVTKQEDSVLTPDSFWPRFDHPKLRHDDGCVFILINFARDMLSVMQEIDEQNKYLPFGGSMNAKLKIGFAHGPVQSGVVGSSSHLFDIFGAPVSVATRLSSLGELNGIHVPQATALVLRYLNIKCLYRGMTVVDPAQRLPTYLVKLDENVNFVADDKNVILIRGRSSDQDSLQSKIMLYNTSSSESYDAHYV